MRTARIRGRALKKSISKPNRIRWLNRLNTRFQITLILVLLSTLAVSQFLLFNNQKSSIYEEEVERASFMADGLSRSLQTLMLSGNAEFAIDWIERVSESPQLLSVQVLRKDQSEAFRDGHTIAEVNRFLDSDAFNRPLLPTRKISDIDSDAFAEPLRGKSFSSLDEERAELTFLLPIKSGEACMSCHGYDKSPVRGVLRVTTSVAHAQDRIAQALQDTIIYGLSVAFVIGLLLFIFIRRQILAPLESIAEATASIADGDLQTRVETRYKTEIGRLGESFNHMTDALNRTTVSREYFETVMRSMGEMLFVTDMEQRIEFANPAVLTTLGYSMDELLGKPIDELIKGGQELTLPGRQKLLQENEIKSIERNFLHHDGHEIPVLITLSVMQNDSQKPSHIIHAGRDITLQKRTERELILAAKVMESDSNAILVCDDKANIVLVNPAFCEITGYSREEVIGNNPRILSSGKQSANFYRNMWETLLRDGMWAGEIWNRRKNGDIYPEWLSITALRNEAGELTNFVSIFNDISEQKNLEQKLSHLAHHDQLTGLPNRTLFTDRLEHALTHAVRENHKVGLMFIDIDGFKAVNDNHGHDIGDALLCVIATRLGDMVRDSDTVARIGGDEFVIILENLNNIEDIIQVAEKILNRFSNPTMAAEISCNIGCSIGIAIAPDDSNNADDLVKKADTAMYLAKSSGKQQYRIFSRDCVKQTEG
ncbi:PAS domain S-box-containing protein/diguanylate cyclase (GGDEF) domain-containing protein [Mariprofundus ferrinatatus]|uniref:PAS domain S-box-containing protein/diguanylate cyclase (GGDEF) domain-containing protein n=1 Tax=Mariprofundus ferrinatatus TaxID=1921087 RepID=A0A2K8L7Q2_9PROT|nr:diguanylate cyclase [Mariprofundus ferrinatatus]ATX82279.1 PAS domain S-box-containing protein/diguanylate cyclase (GGDEF) domain-containing protein [Mariprofundus ferrinatatus]